MIGLSACSAPERDHDGAALAERLLDAFYAWDADTLRALTEPGSDADRLVWCVAVGA